MGLKCIEAHRATWIIERAALTCSREHNAQASLSALRRRETQSAKCGAEEGQPAAASSTRTGQQAESVLVVRKKVMHRFDTHPNRCQWTVFVEVSKGKMRFTRDLNDLFNDSAEERVVPALEIG